MYGLEKEYQGTLKVEVLNAITEENRIKISQYGFRSHGMVIFDGQGNPVKKLDGHFLNEQTIREALTEVMGIESH